MLMMIIPLTPEKFPVLMRILNNYLGSGGMMVSVSGISLVANIWA